MYANFPPLKLFILKGKAVFSQLNLQGDFRSKLKFILTYQDSSHYSMRHLTILDLISIGNAPYCIRMAKPLKTNI